ncbi:hypothetical protein [Brevundimonas sp.]|uniref:hypothetical protein n=1 Tax=Brevundimonas sp. TaxID=1871086 RepID=UPI002486F5CD|nr:hypothetical protein [Brevundimonas sp.]MDI1281302.1 hypothetical protein [Brevundimonas sp.]
MKAQKQMGEEAAAALHARLADLEAADIITDISWVPMEIGATSVAIQFHPRYRLFVEANEAKPPKRGDVIDWNRVERLLIKRLDRT